MEKPCLCLPGSARHSYNRPWTTCQIWPQVCSPSRPSLRLKYARTHIHTYIHTRCKADTVTYTFLWGLAFGQMSAELHVINYEQRERERDIYVSKPAVKPLVSCFPFNVKRPPQRKTSTISTLLCFKTAIHTYRVVIDLYTQYTHQSIALDR